MGACLPCDPSCNTCTGTATNCTSCQNNLELETNLCSCPVGKYNDGNSLCLPCGTKCT
jgi:proprotein convertase subtilisin/kexin type 5